ncbi:MAG TPA: CmcI family methyltransferase [Bryobacteraceae bacterium]|nr:CmcI family methyltransferase [Bryobacteraceae bacterium]
MNGPGRNAPRDNGGFASFAMNLTIDNDNRVLAVEDSGARREFPLYSREAFELISREWVRVGWSLRYYHTFTWFGRPILQLPEDLIRLQEVLYEVKPDVIVETGVFDGGSLLFHASLCEAMGKGRVIGIDVEVRAGVREALAAHPLSHRVTLLEGDSTAAPIVAGVRARIAPSESVLVILDSNHTKAHVAAELEAYAPLVTRGSCIIAADGIMRDLYDVPSGQPQWAHDHPAAAAKEFLARHPEFEMRQPEWKVNTSPLTQNVTYWPDGWLWRKA